MELTQTELLVLGRLTDDPDLFALCQKIDAHKQAEFLEKMRDESQSDSVNTNLVIQYGARASERKSGCKLYLDAARSASKRRAVQESNAPE